MNMNCRILRNKHLVYFLWAAERTRIFLVPLERPRTIFSRTYGTLFHGLNMELVKHEKNPANLEAPRLYALPALSESEAEGWCVNTITLLELLLRNGGIFGQGS